MTTPVSPVVTARRARFSMPGILLATALVGGAALAAATESPTATPTASSPAAELHYVVKRISITTDSGILSIPPGTPVAIIGKAAVGFKIKLPDGRETMATPDQISRDAGVADQAADRDKTENVERTAAARVQAEEAEARRRAQAAAAEQAVAEAQKAAVPVTNSAAVSPAVPWRPGGTLLTTDRSTSLDAPATAAGAKVKPMRYPKPPVRK